jgi:hypothetical protein
MQVIPAAPAAAISPKLEMAWVVCGPPSPQTRLASQHRATMAMAAHSARKRRWAAVRMFISGADRSMCWLLERTQVARFPVDQQECDSSVSPKGSAG